MLIIACVAGAQVMMGRELERCVTRGEVDSSHRHASVLALTHRFNSLPFITRAKTILQMFSFNTVNNCQTVFYWDY